MPKGLREGLRKGNRLQDIVRDNMKIGLSGDDILKASLRQMKDEGIGMSNAAFIGRRAFRTVATLFVLANFGSSGGKVYCHPIGDWGHSAGTLIGEPISPTLLARPGGDSDQQLHRHDKSPGRSAHPRGVALD